MPTAYNTLLLQTTAYDHLLRPTTSCGCAPMLPITYYLLHATTGPLPATTEYYRLQPPTTYDCLFMPITYLHTGLPAYAPACLPASRPANLR